MIIGACGFGSTGSSAVSDFLLEYGNVQVLDKVEFTWVSGVDGLIDLDFHVNHPHNRTTDSIIAIERYRKKFESSIRYYSKVGGMNPELFKQSLESFLNAITTVKWYWAFGEHRDLFDKYIGRRLLANRLYPKIERRTGKLVNKYPLKEVSLSVMPKDFDEHDKAVAINMMRTKFKTLPEDNKIFQYLLLQYTRGNEYYLLSN